MAFNGDVMLNLAAQFLALAEQQEAIVPLMIGHVIGISLRSLEDIAEGRAHFDRAIALYDPAKHAGHPFYRAHGLLTCSRSGIQAGGIDLFVHWVAPSGVANTATWTSVYINVAAWPISRASLSACSASASATSG